MVNHVRDPLVRQLVLDCTSPIPDNYTGVHKFGKPTVEDAEPIDKEYWKEMAYLLGRPVGSREPCTNNGQPVGSSEPCTSNAIRETTGQELQAQPSSGSGEAESPVPQAQIDVAVDERRWRARTIQKGATSFYLENFDKTSKTAAVKIKGEGGRQGLLEWLNHWIDPP